MTIICCAVESVRFELSKQLQVNFSAFSDVGAFSYIEQWEIDSNYWIGYMEGELTLQTPTHSFIIIYNSSSSVPYQQ